MSPERVEHLISLVGPFVSKKQCRSRDMISPASDTFDIYLLVIHSNLCHLPFELVDPLFVTL